MLIIAFIWILFGAVAIAIGGEKQETWRTTLKLGSVVDEVRRFLLIGGGIVSGVTIVASFYFFVFKNALIILITFVVTFLLVRVIIEILLRHGPGESLPPPIAKTPQVVALESAPEIIDPDGLRDESDAEEIESNLEFAPVAATERKVDDGIVSGWENANEPVAKPTPLSRKDESVIKKPQLDMGDPRGGEYNELFNRINKGE